MRRIKIPTPLKGKGKDQSPYMTMYFYIAKRIGRKLGRKFNQSAVFVSPETGAKLKTIEYNWFKDTGEPVWRLERAFPWHWLDYSPAEKAGIQNGYAEVDVDKFYVKEEKNELRRNEDSGSCDKGCSDGCCGECADGE